MTGADPEELPSESVFVLKDDQRRGPYSLEELIELVDIGELDYEDLCLREDGEDFERVRDVLDWEEPVARSQPSPSSSKPTKETAPDSARIMARSPNELLYRGFPSVVAFPWPFLGAVAGVVAGFWLNTYGSWVTIGCFIVALACFAYILLERAMRQYTITNRRVEVITGLIAKSSKEALIDDIRAINVVRRGIPGMLGIGTVEFNTTGDEPEVVFRDVWAAKEVKALVRKIQDAIG